jgi:hypothetical protein
MIKVDLWGRMGNQMFQYAFAIETANKFKTFFTIIPTEKFELIRYFELDFFTRICYNKYFFRAYSFIINRICLFKYFYQVDEKSIDLENNIRYKGFFQSEDYFINSKEKIYKRFEIKKKWKKKYLNVHNTSFSESDKIIVMHFRRTDYVNFGDEQVGGKNLCLPMSYYDNCLKLINNITDYKVVCISDDIKFVKEHYKDREDFIFINNEAIIDFQFILNANIVVVANSSFSWWAAFLNKVEDKVVYAPEFWLGFKVNKEIPQNIIPNYFLTVDVN